MKLLWFLVIIILLSGVVSKALRRQAAKMNERSYGAKVSRYISTIWKSAEWGLNIFGALLLIVTAVYQAFGPIWVMAPEIQPKNALDGSSLIVPFSITSKNILFPVRKITLSCSVNLLYAMDGNRNTILLRDAAVKGGTATLSVSGVDYPCNASLLTIKSDGSLVIGFQQGTFLQSKPGVFLEPLTVIKLCVAIFGSYDNWLGSNWPLPRNLNQWPSAPGGHEWTNEPIVFDDENKWVPDGSILEAAYGARRISDGAGHPLPGALTCDSGMGASFLFSHTPNENAGPNSNSPTLLFDSH